MSKKKSSPETQENLTPTTTPADSTAKDNSLNNPLRIEGIYPFPLMYALKCAHFIKGERITEKEEVRGIATATTEEEKSALNAKLPLFESAYCNRHNSKNTNRKNLQLSLGDYDKLLDQLKEKYGFVKEFDDFDKKVQADVRTLSKAERDKYYDALGKAYDSDKDNFIRNIYANDAKDIIKGVSLGKKGELIDKIVAKKVEDILVVGNDDKLDTDYTAKQPPVDGVSIIGNTLNITKPLVTSDIKKIADFLGGNSESLILEGRWPITTLSFSGSGSQLIDDKFTEELNVTLPDVNTLEFRSGALKINPETEKNPLLEFKGLSHIHAYGGSPSLSYKKNGLEINCLQDLKNCHISIGGKNERFDRDNNRLQSRVTKIDDASLARTDCSVFLTGGGVFELGDNAIAHQAVALDKEKRDFSLDNVRDEKRSTVEYKKEGEYGLLFKDLENYLKEGEKDRKDINTYKSFFVNDREKDLETYLKIRDKKEEISEEDKNNFYKELATPFTEDAARLKEILGCLSIFSNTTLDKLPRDEKEALIAKKNELLSTIDENNVFDAKKFVRFLSYNPQISNAILDTNLFYKNVPTPPTDEKTTEETNEKKDGEKGSKTDNGQDKPTISFFSIKNPQYLEENLSDHVREQIYKNASNKNEFDNLTKYEQKLKELEDVIGTYNDAKDSYDEAKENATEDELNKLKGDQNRVTGDLIDKLINDKKADKREKELEKVTNPERGEEIQKGIDTLEKDITELDKEKDSLKDANTDQRNPADQKASQEEKDKIIEKTLPEIEKLKTKYETNIENAQKSIEKYQELEYKTKCAVTKVLNIVNGNIDWTVLKQKLEEESKTASPEDKIAIDYILDNSDEHFKKDIVLLDIDRIKLDQNLDSLTDYYYTKTVKDPEGQVVSEEHNVPYTSNKEAYKASENRNFDYIGKELKRDNERYQQVQSATNAVRATVLDYNNRISLNTGSIETLENSLDIEKDPEKKAEIAKTISQTKINNETTKKAASITTKLLDAIGKTQDCIKKVYDDTSDNILKDMAHKALTAYSMGDGKVGDVLASSGAVKMGAGALAGKDITSVSDYKEKIDIAKITIEKIKEKYTDILTYLESEKAKNPDITCLDEVIGRISSICENLDERHKKLDKALDDYNKATYGEDGILRKYGDIKNKFNVDDIDRLTSTAEFKEKCTALFKAVEETKNALDNEFKNNEHAFNVFEILIEKVNKDLNKVTKDKEEERDNLKRELEILEDEIKKENEKEPKDSLKIEKLEFEKRKTNNKIKSLKEKIGDLKTHQPYTSLENAKKKLCEDLKEYKEKEKEKELLEKEIAEENKKEPKDAEKIKSLKDEADKLSKKISSIEKNFASNCKDVDIYKGVDIATHLKQAELLFKNACGLGGVIEKDDNVLPLEVAQLLHKTDILLANDNEKSALLTGQGSSFDFGALAGTRGIEGVYEIPDEVYKKDYDDIKTNYSTINSAITDAIKNIYSSLTGSSKDNPSYEEIERAISEVQNTDTQRDADILRENVHMLFERRERNSAFAKTYPTLEDYIISKSPRGLDLQKNLEKAKQALVNVYSQTDRTDAQVNEADANKRKAEEEYNKFKATRKTALGSRAIDDSDVDSLSINHVFTDKECVKNSRIDKPLEFTKRDGEILDVKDTKDEEIGFKNADILLAKLSIAGDNAKRVLGEFMGGFRHMSIGESLLYSIIATGLLAGDIIKISKRHLVTAKAYKDVNSLTAAMAVINAVENGDIKIERDEKTGKAISATVSDEVREKLENMGVTLAPKERMFTVDLNKVTTGKYADKIELHIEELDRYRETKNERLSDIEIAQRIDKKLRRAKEIVDADIERKMAKKEKVENKIYEKEHKTLEKQKKVEKAKKDKKLTPSGYSRKDDFIR